MPTPLDKVWSSSPYRSATVQALLRHPVQATWPRRARIMTTATRTRDLGRVLHFYQQLCAGKTISLPAPTGRRLRDGNHRFAAARLAGAQFKVAGGVLVARLKGR